MTTATTRAPGEFCWINILTPKPADARAFFTKLFGWTYVEMPGMGDRVQLGGRDVGGLFDLASPNTPPGTPAGIGVMVKVENADATSAKAKSLGGSGKPAFDIGEQGRMAECVDPSGAAFDLWQPGKSQGMAVDADTHGAPSWFEVMTTDTDRAKTFYGGLFGWTSEDMQMPKAVYTTFKLGDAYAGGMLKITPEMGPVPPYWGVYFTVKDVDAAMAEAVKLGAKVFLPVQDVPTVGRFAGLASPQGVHFFVIKYNRAA